MTNPTKPSDTPTPKPTKAQIDEAFASVLPEAIAAYFNTPRTDAVTFKAASVSPTNEVVPAAFARTLERELAEAKQAQGWRPMSEAPRDGHAALLAFKDTLVDWDVFCWVSGEWFNPHHTETRDEQFTGWMRPLRPPKDGDK